MKEINLPPFYVGQKVVAIENDNEGDYKKGDRFTIRATEQCPKSKTWYVDIGKYELLENEYDLVQDECPCGESKLLKIKIYPTWYGAKNFAPIQENFQSITLEKVLEEETKLISVN